MKIKVCGMKFPENVRAVAALQPDYLGFIFYPHSPRFVGYEPNKELTELRLPAKKVGVFVDKDFSTIKSIIQKYQLDAVQLHGNEVPEMCGALKTQTEVIKAFGVDDTFDFSRLEPYANCVDFFLFDTKTTAHGGSGEVFNWQILQNYHLKVPFFISGGLSEENIESVLKLKHPAFYGVDLNSRFEISPGLKDLEKLSRTFELIKLQNSKLPS
ncbi:phosphoribosylanthranilate isomerase [Mucilaginibacter arboris]|uniref:N-(5'-phosphoribosyl)anthranilate isomerase n=1 Tax=Mucilaginibacter arboris TaxID=2682090 RepID=A0A7K1SWD1_9SPHI|nr:phosphoribosylanthranilate isomerase [Mucilaginibacter arboris]MVN21547.1 phosphoribosylanthranilate isomerase [Mucilaginibacter arboris]